MRGWLNALAEGQRAGAAMSQATLQALQMRRDLEARDRQWAGEDAVFRGLPAGADAPGGVAVMPAAPAPAPGPAIGPDMGFAPRPVAVPGATPLPAPSPQPPMPGVASQPRPQAPAPAAQPLQGEVLPPQPRGAASGAPLSGVAQPMGDPVLDARNTLNAIASDIRARNPGISSAALYGAVRAQLGMIQGISPMMRSYLDATARMYAADRRVEGVYDTNDTRVETTGMRTASAERIGVGHDDAKVRAAGIYGDTRLGVADRQERASNYRADQGRAGREYVADSGADSRRDVAGINAGSRETVAGINAGSRERAAQIGGDSRVDASLAYATGKDPRAGRAAPAAAPARVTPRGNAGAPRPAGRTGPPPEYRLAPDGFHYKKRPDGKFERWER
jgi:hypothetical protein